MGENSAEIIAIRYRVIELLNEAAISGDSEKVDFLYQVKEIVLNREPELLTEFITPIVSFQADRHVDVRKFVVCFIEEVGKRHLALLNEVLPNLLMMLNDSSCHVLRKVIQTATTIYKHLILWLTESDNLAVDEKLTSIWNTFVSIKTNIINMIDSDAESVRSQTVKFMEHVIILQTPRDEESTRPNDLPSVFDIPITLKFTKRRKLEEEAMVIFDLLVRFHTSKHITNVGIMTGIGALTNIATLRPQFIGKVVATFENVHSHLPVALSESQLSSIRKFLKKQILRLLKFPVDTSYEQNLVTLLTDLGTPYAEVLKMFPKQEEENRKRKQPSSKRNDVGTTNSSNNNSSSNSSYLPAVKKTRREGTTSDSTVEITETFVYERLTPSVVAEIVLITMENLPPKMPSLFNSAYTPIAAAGTPSQIKHVSRLLASQLHSVNLGPGSSLPAENNVDQQDEQESDIEEVKPKPILTAVGSRYPIKMPPRTLKLSEITKPMPDEMRDRLAVQCVSRILKSERTAIDGGATRYRFKIITSIATTFGLPVREAILEYILSDIRHRFELALAWLYEEYSILQGFYKLPEILQHNQKPDHNYNTLFCSLSLTIIERYELRDRETILPRLYLEAPLITENGLDILKEVSSEQSCVLSLLRQLVVKRPAKQLLYLNILLERTSHYNVEIQQTAVKLVCELYTSTDLRKIIEDYATFFLNFLKLESPSNVLFEQNKAAIDKTETWNENLAKSCLHLYIALLEFNENLIHELLNVYAVTNSDIKRIILRFLDSPLQIMNISLPNLLKVLDELPTGAETLITRILNIITDKKQASPELVAKVKELYQSRVTDIRFLIPVMNSLSKQEIISALPKLIKLNPNVMKEVFNRILNVNSDGSRCISPSELLIALHKLDPSRCELKCIMKATSICLADREIFTTEVLAVVIQNLMDITPLPTLLMRTVIQSISLYPELIGFCMNILQRLILKQVWKNKKVWEGFIKCCQRTKPSSFQVLLQLPAEQLQDVFKTEPDLLPSLKDHISSTLTDSQKAHIPKDIIDILYGSKPAIYSDFEIKKEPMSPGELTIDIKEEVPDEAQRTTPQIALQ